MIVCTVYHVAKHITWPAQLTKNKQSMKPLSVLTPVTFAFSVETLSTLTPSKNLTPEKSNIFLGCVSMKSNAVK